MILLPATNYVLYSGVFSSPYWSTPDVGLADITNSVPANATGHAWRMACLSNAPGTPQQLAQGGIPAYAPSSQFTLTVWVYPETWTARMGLWLFDSNRSGVYCSFNPANPNDGTATANIFTSSGTPAWTSPTCHVVALTGGWFTVTIQGNTSTAMNIGLGVMLASISTLAAPGTTIQVGGFALYYGNFTGYIDTTSTPQNQLLPVFSWPMHKLATRYPQNGLTVQMGGSYTFSVAPSGPPQRMFALSFKGLRWRWNVNGTVDTYTDPTNNVGALDAFYQTMQLYQPFVYPHMVYGPRTVRFAKPLALPETNEGSPNDVIGTVTVDLIEQP